MFVSKRSKLIGLPSLNLFPKLKKENKIFKKSVLYSFYGDIAEAFFDYLGDFCCQHLSAIM